MAKKKQKSSIILQIILLLFVIIVIYFAYKYRIELKRLLNKTHEINQPQNYSVYGIDVSQYQSIIQWNKIGKINNTNPVQFVFIRATAGINKRDRFFTSNWRDSKKNGFIRGAYHYYRPNENSIKQAENFIKNVSLKKGDLPPVLDIEKLSTVQNIKSLRTGLFKWIKKIEDHYQVKPIIYSSSNYFNIYLKNDFDNYIVWVANYNKTNHPISTINWDFWQYTCYGKINGIKGSVDLNVYKNDINSLKSLCIE